MYYDASTWPKHFKADDIKQLLHGRLRSKTIHPNYSALEAVFPNDHKTVNTLLETYVNPPPPKAVDVDVYLCKHLTTTSMNAAMKLQERTGPLTKLNNALSVYAGMPNIAFSSSPRGCGKTQFIKGFVSSHRAAALKCGRVIVRCCDKGRNDFPQSTASSVSKGSTSIEEKAVLCELIRKHVHEVTGRLQDESAYRDPPTAYATWISETARFFEIPPNAENVDPLILLDTCEFLAQDDHKSLVHECTRKPYTLLEALCLAVPAPYGIFVIGCNARINARATANVTDIGPLLPLSNDGFHKAHTDSWNSKGCQPTPLMHSLCGGVPRLLRECGSFESLTAAARSFYPVDAKLCPHAYTCLLASSTKAKVMGSDVIGVNPAWRGQGLTLTYDGVTTQSIGSYDPTSNLFTIPPITFDDSLVRGKCAPILPSQLHPFIDCDFVARCGAHSTEELEAFFVKSFLVAVRARYLLAYWRSNAADPWVSLAKVFDGAVSPDQVALLERHEVNLSSDVKVHRVVADAKQRVFFNSHLSCRVALTHTGASRKKNDAAFSFPLHVVSHSSAKSLEDHVTIHLKTNHLNSFDKQVVKIIPDAMCSVMWLIGRHG